MRRRVLAVLLIPIVVILAVLPLLPRVSDPSGGVVSSSDDLPMYVREGGETHRGAVGAKYAPDEVIVKFRTDATEHEVQELRVARGAHELYVSPFTQARRWRVPPSRTVEEWAEFFDRHPLVEYAEPNYYAYTMMTPNDLLYPYQWHLDNAQYGGIHMESAWDVETGDSKVVVAVVDTGVAYEENAAPALWHIDTYRAYSGHSWWCGVSSAPSSWTALYGSASTPPGYGNGWKEYLQHTFDLTSATGTVTFSYQYRHDLEVTAGRPYDKAFTEISTDDGSNWITLRTYTAKRNWKAESIDLSSYAGSTVLIRFRVYSDDVYSDEDGDFDSDGAFFVDDIRLTDGSGTVFYDDVESGAGAWETTRYEQAPDLVGTSFWTNTGEIPDDEIDNDGNGFVDDVHGWDFMNADAQPNDDEGHGTHVSGTVAQTTNNDVGVAGVGFGTTVMPVKVLNAAGTGTHQQIADGIAYAVDNGADIISLSLGGPGSTTLENAVAYAYTHGVTVIAASGNGNTGSCDYPAAYDAYVIAVGATQYDETRAPYSNYGASLDLVAPGGNTAVDLNGDEYGDGVLQNTFGDTPVDWAYWFYQGTSMSTPHVSGVAALLLARDPTLTPDQIREVLQSTAEDLGAAGRDDTYGWGLLDAQAALQRVTPPVHLLLTVEPDQATYSTGQSVDVVVTVFNQLNPPLNSTLTMTVTGPSGYSAFEVHGIAVAADAVDEIRLTWTIPDAAGTYVVEVGLVPPVLTAYDAVWLDVE